MASDSERVVIPDAQEDAAIHRERVEKGVVRVRKIVHERTELIDEPMLHDEVDIEHVAVNRPVEAPEPPREEGDVLVMPRREVQTRHREQVVLRDEEPVVERLATKGDG